MLCENSTSMSSTIRGATGQSGDSAAHQTGPGHIFAHHDQHDRQAAQVKGLRDATPNELLDERTAKRKLQNVERVQRCRARKLAGARIVRIEVMDWAETVDAFVRIGVLKAEQRRNKAIEAAIAVLCRRGYRAIKGERETGSR
jgi:hypothetical protein